MAATILLFDKACAPLLESPRLGKNRSPKLHAAITFWLSRRHFGAIASRHDRRTMLIDARDARTGCGIELLQAEPRARMTIPERAERTKTFSLQQEVTEQHEDQPSEDEGKRIRRLQIMMSMVMSVIGQDPSLTVEEASELAAGAKRAALAMFPDKELAYDLIYKPRVQRLMRERFRLQ
jgi:hypothetical protein